jgi:hypothetical protein
MDVLHCWRCGAGLTALSLPLSRMDECPECTVSLHVCRMCSFYDPVVAKACREDDADEVKEKERPNFCDYFRPTPDAFDADVAAADAQARGQLDALFRGDDTATGDKSDTDPDAAEDLFK